MATTSPEQTAPVAPAIILVEPQLGENIGFVARAMLNCGLTELRLVAPRQGWPNEKARKVCAGADSVLDSACVFASARDAVGDLSYVLATTARPRDTAQDILDGGEAAGRLVATGMMGARSGILFGREATGLVNDDLVLADALIEIPLNPDFASLNLAQAVLIVAYEWFQASRQGGGRSRHPDGRRDGAGPQPRQLARKADFEAMLAHLETELDACGFLRVPEMRPVTVRNIRTMLTRAGMSDAEVRTFRGIIAGLARLGRARVEDDVPPAREDEK